MKKLRRWILGQFSEEELKSELRSRGYISDISISRYGEDGTQQTWEVIGRVE